MIQIQSKAQFAKAIERARNERLLAQPLRFREYAVTDRSRFYALARIAAAVT